MICSIFFSCQQSPNSKNQRTFNTEPKVDTSYIAIIPYHEKNEARKATNLTSTDLVDIDSILVDFSKDYNSHISKSLSNSEDKKNYLINLRDYKRQYTPTKNINGEKEVIVYCMCDVSNVDWKHESKIVRDGGKCYFTLTINLTTKKYNIYMNGGA